MLDYIATFWAGGKIARSRNQTKGGNNVVPISKPEYILILPPFLKGIIGLMLAFSQSAFGSYQDTEEVGKCVMKLN